MRAPCLASRTALLQRGARGVSALLAAAVLGACGGGGDDNAPPATGSATLSVTVAGVASDTALVRVDGPVGTEPRFVSATTTLTSLPSGSYTITPTDALTTTAIQRAAVQSVTLAAGETRAVTVNYASAAAFALRLQPVFTIAAGLVNPIDLQAPRGDARLFIAERPGRIRIAQNGALLATPFLDISSRVDRNGEGGLLSFAFHPQFGATSPYVYVAFSTPTGFFGGDLVVERFELAPGDANRLLTPGVEVLRIPHRESVRHYAGRLAFGPDGMLYLSTGDGSMQNDELHYAQDVTVLHGKLLRLDVSTLPYTVPAGNPTWSDAPGARRESWAIGLRNPWRYSFDPPSGLLYIGDVGQARREEINVVPAASAGLNYGWSIREGTQCFNATTCPTAGLTMPILDYDHTAGCSVIGGYVYRGDAIPALRGRYLYSDFCRGYLASLRFEGGVLVERVQWTPGGSGTNPQSFGVDGAGEIYMLMQDGRVQRVTS
jgi:glucose/arabinose dehydrogenase